MRRGSVLTLVALAVVAIASCQRPPEYPPVTPETLAGTHYAPEACGPKAARFDWSFTASRFHIAARPEPIPPVLLTAILGPGRTASVVEGGWRIEGNGDLVLFDVTADGVPINPAGRLRVDNTGVIRVRPPEDVNAQYVFSR
jgi:hypothetical protein